MLLLKKSFSCQSTAVEVLSGFFWRWISKNCFYSQAVAEIGVSSGRVATFGLPNFWKISYLMQSLTESSLYSPDVQNPDI